MGPCRKTGNGKPGRQSDYARHRDPGLAYRVQLQCTVTEWCDKCSYSVILGAARTGPHRTRGPATTPKASCVCR
eukprot:6494183-Pyramimonas_sp.AAC.1